ncbi:hypothetical protein K227x_51830 [Rubripirellula lacrimiformis]|uniref:Type 4 fimbrial biogenesis protein PilX N-terminal domain-containing protein n=1 Tax=Rubripirellula lacrimiformis TaxID=1930273 RepID=A0A517NI06_9BACT|nr:hypothetical protein [Rubripirellula lacrimiformis]QDT06767.1 hypothetical protein K227x_51830 [Rubripirellula lacrimiformis]
MLGYAHFTAGPRPTGNRSRPRQGYLYVAVLLTSLVVSSLLAAALTVSTATLSGQSDIEDRGRAIRLAESEMHRLASTMRVSTLWRTANISGDFSTWRTWSSGAVVLSGPPGQVRYRYTDLDGDLADDPRDDVELTVHTKVGRAEYAVSATLQWDRVPYRWLNYDVTSFDNLGFQYWSTLSTEGPTQVAGDCTATLGGYLMTPQLECNGSVSSTLQGTQVAGNIGSPPADLVGQYELAGTVVLRGSIPVISSNHTIQKCVLSPTSNPFGAANAEGVYNIDMQNQKLVIQDCRISGTLAIRNASEIVIRNGVHWSYPTTADAILVTDSPVTITGIDRSFGEADLNVNFNPTSTPFRGTSDIEKDDLYSSEFRGVIYSSSTATLEATDGDWNLIIIGAVVANGISVTGHASIFKLHELSDDPADRLCDPNPMRFVRGSWRRIDSP